MTIYGVKYSLDKNSLSFPRSAEEKSRASTYTYTRAPSLHVESKIERSAGQRRKNALRIATAEKRFEFRVTVDNFAGNTRGSWNVGIAKCCGLMARGNR